MRILHVVHQYVPDHVAGTELYTQMVARRQVDAGHAVAVFTPLNRAGLHPTAPAVEDSVRVYRVPIGQRSATAVFRSTYRQPVIAQAFTAALDAERPDVVHLQHLMGVPAAVGSILRERGVPYVISLHDYWYGCANGQLLTNYSDEVCGGPDAAFRNCGQCALARAGLPAPAALGVIVGPLMRRRNALLAPIFAAAARVLAPNEFVRRIYADMGFPTGHVVVNPLGLDSPPDLPDRMRARRAERPAGGLRLGYLGSISRQKGVHTLIAAVNNLPDSVTLDIYGDLDVFPDYAAELRELAGHPGIRFHGLLARGRLWDALADLDALVMPTLWYEGSPAIIREAFAAGVPIVASDLGAPGSMVRHGVDGLLFPPGDAAALKRSLRELVERPERLAQLRAGIPPVRPVADHVAQINALYEEVLAGGMTNSGKWV